MPEPTPTKPYLLRALYEWCVDNGFTPYVSVVVDAATRVPPEHVKKGEIVLNVGPLATNRLRIGNEMIEFSARFGGVAREISIPVAQVAAIYARENGQGLSFDLPSGGRALEAGGEESASRAQPPEAPEPPEPRGSPRGGRPALRRIK
ncbi:MAG: ClpXP protease specificity-enhancing factor [Burkholderiales bacterium]|nr:ClpXP protease specificity-enhancing factor [Burkholderiales bacterium]